MKPLTHLGEKRLDAGEHARRRAMALLQGCDAGDTLRAGLCRVFATLPHHAERFLSRRDLLFELSTRLFKYRDFFLAHRDDRFLLTPLSGKPPQLGLRNVHALGYTRHLRIELLQHVA